VAQGIVASVCGTTIWRWLSADAIKPWRVRSWIFPRGQAFAAKAGKVPDRYARTWEGEPAGEQDHVVSADAKTSIQARIRRHASLPAAPRRPPRTESEYTRGGALPYLAAWDVHRARVFGRCEPATGIGPFRRLVTQVMTAEPCRSARKVFWVVDNGSSHRGQAAARRLQGAWPALHLVHRPIHPSWLNQVEVCFSVIQRKILTPSHFGGLAEAEAALLAFQDSCQQIATPFGWKFTKSDLDLLLKPLAAREPAPALAA
jgi:DDE superfamily endonuclease